MPPGAFAGSNIILVGTKNDRAEDEEQRTFFRTDIRKEFFKHAPSPMAGAVALVSQDDYSELRREISSLPGLGIVCA